MRLLLVEDYGPLLHSLSQALREAGYAVEVASDGESALECARARTYDVMVLDLMLPKLDGFAVLGRLRAEKNVMPVLVLTARATVLDRVKGLDMGADDYLVKPFALAELLARVRALIRRRYQSPECMIRIGDLEVDTASRTVRRAGVPVPLSAREYALLEYLAVRKGQVVTRTEILDHVYDFASEPSSNVIDVYIGYLRKKLEHEGEPRLIHTRRGQGYLVGEDE